MSLTSRETMGKREAQDYFRETAPTRYDTPRSTLEKDLRDKGITEVDLGLNPSSFQDLSDQYAICIDDHPEYLNGTAGSFDRDRVPEDGHVSKGIKFNKKGMQISDPKSIFHFNGSLTETIARTKMLKGAPSEFREFIEHGIDLHKVLAQKARRLVEILDVSYVRMSELYFPDGHKLGKVTLRLLRYDGYPLIDENGNKIATSGEQVAKGHYDRGGLTIQAYASAPGFWIHPELETDNRKPTTDEDKIHPPYGAGKSQLFAGIGHRKVYGTMDPIPSLFHGVDRIFDETKGSYMPPRTAAISFIETPHVNTGVTSKDTQPDRADTDKLTA